LFLKEISIDQISPLTLKITLPQEYFSGKIILLLRFYQSIYGKIFQ